MCNVIIYIYYSFSCLSQNIFAAVFLAFLVCVVLLSLLQELIHKPLIKEELISYLLAEIATSNPLFPVNHVYRQLLLKKKPEEKSASSLQGEILSTEL